MEKRPRSDLTSVGSLISKSLDEGYLGLARETVRVFEVWGDAVGPFNAARTQPESIKNGRLTVLVESSVWIDRFSYFRTEFIRKINDAVGAELVQDLQFRVGAVKPSRKSAAVEPESAEAGKAAQKDSETIQAAVASIKDPDLKKNLAALLSRQKSSPKA